jgi:hypothetical protein
MRSFKALALTATVAGAALLSGCAAVRTPVSGCLYLDVKDGSAVSSASPSKMGSAQATTILGWVGTGDASISAAAKAGGISKIAYVDYKSTNILGIFGTYTTVVYGE